MKKILIIAGEASGDLHGANLVRELHKTAPDIAVYGVGSKNMQAAGVNMLADAAEISVVGATEVFTHIGAIYRVYAKLKKFLKDEQPALLILIDFPDFNLLIGKTARKLGIDVLYYVSPQVWAWRKGRARKIAKLVRTIMVFFPFEVPIYREVGADVRFVGHPLVDIVRSDLSMEEARISFGMNRESKTVALLPGSRKKEIENLLPDMLQAAKLLRNKFPDIQFVLPVAPTLDKSFINEFVVKSGVAVTLADGRVYDALRASDAAIVASGTATLETGLMAVPMVIIYRMSRLSFFIGRMIINVKHIGLVNIVAGKTVAPELIQNKVTPENIAASITDVLRDSELNRHVRNELENVRSLLGGAGASAKAARTVLEFLAK